MNADARSDIEWIAVDWGTTNLRAWAMAGGTPVAAISAGTGMGGLERDQFEPALLAAIGHWLPEGRATDIVACGMVGARQGWIDAGYEPVPGPPRRDAPLVRAPAEDLRINVHILHGLMQDEPADVMRGEETQIAGFLAHEPAFDGVVCLPGTHAKWVRVADGTVKSFTTFMTGELFALLARQSVLRHTVADGWSDPDFADAVDQAVAHPEQVAARLFGLRAGSLFGRLDGPAARARLSGLLIGLELAATRPFWQDSDSVALIGSESICTSYANALGQCGARSRRFDVTDMTLAGLTAAHDAQKTRKASA